MLAETNEVSNLNEYKKFMYKRGVSEGAEVIPYSNCIPLEYNAVFLNGGMVDILKDQNKSFILMLICFLSFIQ